MNTHTNPSRPLRLLAVALATVLALVACGGDDDGEAGAPDGEAAAAAGAGGGEIVVSGSSTVEPISAAVAEKFSAQRDGVSIRVDGPGTGDGFELFCNGDTDVSDASRPIDPEEVETCEANGVEFVELQVAIDGLSVITAPENDLVECLSFADLYALLGPESTGFDRWADANELGTEVGGSGDFPDAELVVTAPGEESGTYDSFVEIVLGPLAEERGQDEAARPDYQASANDNVIIDGVAGSSTSLGWVGYAFVVQNADRVKPLAIEEEEGSGCVEPTDETIASGEFPIARPLFVYVNVERAEANADLAAYVDFYLTDEGIASVAEVGYVALGDDVLAETRSTWEARRTGTRQAS